jgi:hypothetical protein
MIVPLQSGAAASCHPGLRNCEYPSSKAAKQVKPVPSITYSHTGCAFEIAMKISPRLIIKSLTEKLPRSKTKAPELTGDGLGAKPSFSV